VEGDGPLMSAVVVSNMTESPVMNRVGTRTSASAWDVGRSSGPSHHSYGRYRNCSILEKADWSFDLKKEISLISSWTFSTLFRRFDFPIKTSRTIRQPLLIPQWILPNDILISSIFCSLVISVDFSCRCAIDMTSKRFIRLSLL